MSTNYAREAADRAAIDDAPEVPAPLEHRGPDTTKVFDTHDGFRIAVDRQNAHDGWLVYDGPTTAVLR